MKQLKVFIGSCLCVVLVVFFCGCRKKLNEVVVSSPPATVERVISRGVEVNEKDGQGRTALHYAVSAGRANITKLLIDKGAFVDAPDNDGWTPLHIACLNSQYWADVIVVLLENGADVNASDSAGMQPIHYIASSGAIKAFDIVCQWGADVNVKNDFGHTPLHCAINKKHKDMSKHLIKHGADLSIADSIGLTPLSSAIAVGDVLITKLILEAMDDQGLGVDNISPLHRSVIEADTDTVKRLIGDGWQIGDRLEGKYTAINLANRLHPHNIVLKKLLEKAEAKHSQIPTIMQGPLQQDQLGNN